MLDDERLPSATVEEMFSPDEVVAVNTPDGGVRLLLYCGPRRDGGYLLLKHVVLRPAHARAIIKGTGPSPDDLTAARGLLDDHRSQGQGVAQGTGAGAAWRDPVPDAMVSLSGATVRPDGQGEGTSWSSIPLC